MGIIRTFRLSWRRSRASSGARPSVQRSYRYHRAGKCRFRHSRCVGPVLEAMQNDQIALCNGPFDLDPLARPLPRHSLKIIYEADLAGCDMGVVLYVVITSISLDCLARFAVVEHE